MPTPMNALHWLGWIGGSLWRQIELQQMVCPCHLLDHEASNNNISTYLCISNTYEKDTKDFHVIAI